MKKFRKVNGIENICVLVDERGDNFIQNVKESLSKELPFELRSGLSGSQPCENLGHELPSRGKYKYIVSEIQMCLLYSSIIKEVTMNKVGGRGKISSGRAS